MNRAADVRSVEAIRAFRADLVEYQGKLRQALESLGVELSRGEGWFQNQRSYWPAESRRASDQIAEARAALGRCMLGKGKERPSACDDERKLVVDAKRRLSFTEQQITVTKNWCLEVSQESDDFRNRLSRAVSIVEGDIPKAIASLDRITESLDRYTEQANSSTSALGNTFSESSESQDNATADNATADNATAGNQKTENPPLEKD